MDSKDFQFKGGFFVILEYFLTFKFIMNAEYIKQKM
jgi:hypothetical protein